MRRQWRLDGIARKLRCRQLLTVPLNTGDDLVRQSAVGHRACALRKARASSLPTPINRSFSWASWLKVAEAFTTSDFCVFARFVGPVRPN